jgi:hypothetical protein
MFNGLDREVNIKLRPIKVMRSRQLNIEEWVNRNVTEPGKVLERYKQLSVATQEPEAVFRDIRNLNSRNALSKPCGFHFHAPAMLPLQPCLNRLF